MVVAEVADDRRVEALGLLERDEALAAADERVAAEPALVDGLEQERGTSRLAQPEIGRERCDEVGVDGRDCHRFGNENDPLGSRVEQQRVVDAVGA